jgi:hypothetical protein
MLLNAAEGKSVQDKSVNFLDQWFYFDPETKIYSPYIPTYHSGVKSLVFPLDWQKLRQKELNILLPERTYVFINNRLLVSSDIKGYTKIKWQNLKQFSPPYFLTIYNSSGFQNQILTVYGTISETTEKREVQEIIQPRPEYAQIFNDFFVIALLSVFILQAVLKSYHLKIYLTFYGLRGDTAFSSGQSFVLRKPLNINNLFALLIHSLAVVLTLFLIQNLSENFLGVNLYEKNDSLPVLSYKLLWFAVITLILYILKYFLIAVVSILFNLKEFRYNHYFYSIRISMLFYAFFLPLTAVLYLWNGSLPDFFYSGFLVLAIAGFSIIKILIISYSLNKIRPFRNLYLFSYLCATELIPLFFAIKLVVI